MNKIKKTKRLILSFALIFIFALSLAACAKTDIPTYYSYDDFSKYITLGEYKDLTYKNVEAKVPDKQVNEEIGYKLLENSTKKEIKEGTVAEDSVIKIDYEGTIDGKKEESATAKDQEIDIANSSFIDGFVESMVGRSVGDNYDVDLNFPEDYANEELRGKPVTFNITIKAIIESKVPELTDEYCKKYTEYDNVKDYKASVRKSLEDQAEKKAIDDRRTELFGKILDASKVVELPEKELAATKEKIIKTYHDLAEQYGMEYEEFLGSYTGMSEKDFNTQVDGAAENTVKQQLTVYALAKELDISISKKEYNEHLDKLLADAGYEDRDSFEKAAGTSIDDYADQQDLYSALLYQKVMDKIIEMSKPE